MFDLIALLIGFLVGTVAAGFAVELGRKKWLAPPDRSKLTQVWTLTELPAPLIVASNLEGVNVPKGARVVTSGTGGLDRGGFEVRVAPDLKANFAVDARAGRALLFLGGLRKGSLAVWTVDEKLIERLRAEFNRLWARSHDWVEEIPVAQVPSKANLTVRTAGRVEDVIPYRGNYMLRLTEKGESVGVIVEKDLALQGRRVSVTGVVRTSSSGFPLIEATEVLATA